jgi:hypothetical protein
VLAIVEQPMILVLSTTQATSPASTTRHTVEQEIKRGNLTAKKAGHTWVIDDAGAKRRAAQFRPHEGAVEAGQTSKPGRQ